ncbi:hypothetical protein IU448_28450 [Nocardia flavorosea]|uniref:hypothetical protein n=1 Tax=Nocardia flavorosea TaxID=53429 RepID=UPI0018954242|nr:hypothetical protein [Nocardia flavorosea]MBF6352912.1 hypothetical protein [Nocardia flavorosea]
MGRRIAAEHPDASPEELATYVKEAVLRGDTVVVGPDGTLTPSDQVGGKIDMDETFMQQGNILVFLENGEVARATYIIPDLLQPGEYSSSVRVTADGYPALLEMSE